MPGNGPESKSQLQKERKEKRNKKSLPIVGSDLHSGKAIKGLISACVAEFFCTAAFLLWATGTVASGCHTADTARASGATDTSLEKVIPGACFLGTTNVLNIALAFGLSIFVLVYAAASFSGGHLNPAVTVAMLCARRISLLRAFLYIISQMAGAIVGSALVRAFDPQGFMAALGASNRLNDWVNVGKGVGIELLLTALFVFVVLAATDQSRGATTPHIPVLAPFAIGIALFLCHLVAVPIDGCSVNPARSFGTAVTSNTWHQHWIFWVGPFAGAIFVGMVYEYFAYRALAYVGPMEETGVTSGQKRKVDSPAGSQEDDNV